MDDSERVIMQVACTDYDSGSKLVSAMLDNMAKMVGSDKADILSGPAESAMGWDFYPIAISKALVQRLASVPENDIWRMKGNSLDEKFTIWLNRQLKLRAEGIEVKLLSELKSSRFGLF